jgi:hypothetical protein
MVTVSPVVIESSSGRVGMNVQRIVAVDLPDRSAALWVEIIRPPEAVDGVMGSGYAGLLYDADGGVRAETTGELACPWKAYWLVGRFAADFSDVASNSGKRSRPQVLLSFLLIIDLLLLMKNRTASRASRMPMTKPAILPPDSPPALLDMAPDALPDGKAEGGREAGVVVMGFATCPVAEGTADGELLIVLDAEILAVAAEELLERVGSGFATVAGARTLVETGGGAVLGGAAMEAEPGGGATTTLGGIAATE